MSHQSQAHPGPATNYSKAPGCHLSLRDPRYSHRKTARWDRLPFRSLSDSSRKGGFTTLAECLYHIYGPKHQRPLRTDCRLDCGQGLCCVPIFHLTQLESISVKLTPRAQHHSYQRETTLVWLNPSGFQRQVWRRACSTKVMCSHFYPK